MKTLSIILVATLIILPPTSSLAGQTSRSSDSHPKSEIAPIDINRATTEDFATLPGVGPELARRIVAHREKHGLFRRVEDLLVIRGIGRKKWRAIRPYLRVGSNAESKTQPSMNGSRPDARRERHTT